MKIRKGFVSNSSSSSFTCEICGASESGWDACPEELGFVTCEHEHLFCEHEKLKKIKQVDLDEDRIRFMKDRCESDIDYSQDKPANSWSHKRAEEARKILEQIKKGNCPDFRLEDYGYNITEIECPICNFEEPSYSDLETYFLRTTNISRDEVFAEIKKINKRRRVLRTHEYVEYCLRKQNKNVDEMLQAWKEEFETYSKFKKYLRTLKK